MMTNTHKSVNRAINLWSILALTLVCILTGKPDAIAGNLEDSVYQYYEPGQFLLPEIIESENGWCNGISYTMAGIAEVSALSKIYSADKIIISDSSLSFSRRFNFPDITFMRFYDLNYANVAINSMTETSV